MELFINDNWREEEWPEVIYNLHVPGLKIHRYFTEQGDAEKALSEITEYSTARITELKRDWYIHWGSGASVDDAYRIAASKIYDNQVAFVDLDGVIADSTARAAKASESGKMNWDVMFNPALVELDTLIENVVMHLELLQKQGYTIHFITSRPETMRDATMAWLERNGIEHHASLIMKDYSLYQYTKTAVWKAKMISEFLATNPCQDVSFIDDEQSNREAVEALGGIGTFEKLEVAANLYYLI